MAEPTPRQVLRKIDDMISGKANKDVQSYKIEDREMSRMTIAELMHWKTVYTNLVLAEQGQLFGEVTVE